MKMTRTACLAATLFLFGACGGDEPTDGESKSGGIDVSSFADDGGKSDLAKSTKVIDDMKPDSTVKGQFSRKIRTYGYIVNGRKGAELKFALKTVKGSDAATDADSLDTMYVVHGPYKDSKNPGPKLIESDDTSDTDLNPPSTSLKIEEDGKYFIAFTSYDDTGDKSEYELNIACEGTDFQCSVPSATQPCKKGELYIQGNSITESQTWDKCDVIVLENVTIQEKATVTVKPGVSVRNNFIQGSGDDFFGEVRLNVLGTLQAAGTEKNPIRFTNFVEDRGWGGIFLSSKSNTIEHAYIENVQVGVELAENASATLDNVVLEGDPRVSVEAPDRNTLFAQLRQTRSTAGVLVGPNAEATVKRSLVKKFREGFRILRSTLVSMEDSVVRYNRTGIYVEGEGGQVRTSCNTRQPAPPQRFFDPKVDHTDIIDNADFGFLLRQDGVFIQVQKSNIVDNGRDGIRLEGGGLTEDSFIRENNIYGNNGATDMESTVQVASFHASGAIDLSNNYWKFISDPNLSQTRQTCNTTNAPVIYTGFSPTLIEDAGPRGITEQIKEDSFAQTKQQ